MKKSLIITAALAASISAQVFAQEVVVISTGGPKGTYSSFFKSIQMVCGEAVQLIEKPSAGSDANIDNLINKQADAAFVQSDTLQFTAMNDPRASDSQIRVLLPLYPEEVHVVALKDLSKTSGGVSVFGKNLGGTKIQLNSLADLEGVKVGAWGGSFTTARAISYLGGVKYETVQYEDDKKAMAALQSGEIAAIVAVGGQPLGFVSGLSGNFKLLKIDSGLADKVKAYQKARVNYRNLSADSTETVAARSMLVVKNYATPARKEKLAILKRCMVAHIADFKEGTGHHPKWNDVELDTPVSWAMYDIGSVPVAKKK
jgi:TRAP-type uncharacterized transport system substrate-binding protein